MKYQRVLTDAIITVPDPNGASIIGATFIPIKKKGGVTKLMTIYDKDISETTMKNNKLLPKFSEFSNAPRRKCLNNFTRRDIRQFLMRLEEKDTYDEIVEKFHPILKDFKAILFDQFNANDKALWGDTIHYNIYVNMDVYNNLTFYSTNNFFQLDGPLSLENEGCYDETYDILDSITFCFDVENSQITRKEVFEFASLHLVSLDITIKNYAKIYMSALNSEAFVKSMKVYYANMLLNSSDYSNCTYDLEDRIY